MTEADRERAYRKYPKGNSRAIVAAGPPMELLVTPELAREIGANDGDIVTLGSRESPAREWRTGAVVPPEQRFRVTISPPRPVAGPPMGIPAIASPDPPSGSETPSSPPRCV